jgi:hypothetical protein
VLVALLVRTIRWHLLVTMLVLAAHQHAPRLGCRLLVGSRELNNLGMGFHQVTGSSMVKHTMVGRSRTLTPSQVWPLVVAVMAVMAAH